MSTRTESETARNGALILAFKQNESMFLTGGIEVFVAGIRGDKVRLGIRAPDEVRVLRQCHMTDKILAELDTVPIPRKNREMYKSLETGTNIDKIA